MFCKKRAAAWEVRRLKGSLCLGLLALGIGLVAGRSARAQTPAELHTDPLNLSPEVQRGYQHFYNLDYDGALKIFNQVAAERPQDPMAWDYVLTVTIFRELYHQDLLDTTYYAHNNFLTTKRQVDVAPATRNEIEGLTNKVIALCNGEISTDSNNKNAYFARGYARGMHAVFITLADHSFAAAARQGYQSRNDSEQVLKIDPGYADADMAIGIQQFAVASLPRWVRLVVGFMGVGGNKQKGLAMLRESATRGVATNVESRTVLSLFLRHDGRYPEALQVERGLAEEFPHNFVFQLEVANLLKDEGQGLQAIAAYKLVLEEARRPGYFIDPRLQMAWFGMADTERGYNLVKDAAADYQKAAMQPGCSDWLRKRALLDAGEMLDLLHQRAESARMYQMVLGPGNDRSQDDAARRYRNAPFAGK
jgi:tetratricopeptide (TPR) repeat protein